MEQLAARATPAVTENAVIIGTQGSIFAPGGGPGGWVLAFDKRTGALLWKTQADQHFAAIITQSATVFDGKVYVWDGKGTDLPGFPVLVDYRGGLEREPRVSRIVTTPAVGDMNGDGLPEIAVGSNEYLGTGGNLGAFFLIDGRGNNAPGGNPSVEGWPVTVGSFKLFPLVGEGVVSAEHFPGALHGVPPR